VASDVDWARIAAWIETEGCIHAAPTRRGSYRPCLHISQKEREPLEWIHAITGGSLHHKDGRLWVLDISNTATIAVLSECLPYFIHPRKKREAKLLLRMYLAPREEKHLYHEAIKEGR
jgi:hypothetical protein